MSDVPSWVLDTNVLVAGLLNPTGYPGRLVDAIFAGALRLTFDDRIEREYHDVLARPKFKIPAELVDAVLQELRNHDSVTAAPQRRRLPDPDDLPFLEVAVYATDRVLVTGNTKHFPPAHTGDVVVLSPKQAWERLTSS